MAVSPKFQAIIDAAKEKTRKMQEQSALASLPSSNVIALKQQTSVSEVKPFEGNKTITVNGRSFNPYEIEIAPGQFLILNEEQCRAVDWFGLEGRSGCLIGPAGTGKTTTMKAIIRAATLCGRIPIIPNEDTHKYISPNTPGIWGGSFTRIATRNLRDNVPDDIKPNIHTIHRLLEFEPTFVTVEKKDEKGIGTGEFKEIRIFMPTRDRNRTLSRYIKMYDIDESSMVGTALHEKFIAALPDSKNTQILYIGDIAQLPPVMDDSILGYKLLELPVVELIHVYRHAGRIVNLANHIRTGNTIPDARVVMPYAGNLRRLPRKLVEDGIAQWNGEEDGSKVTIHLWKNRLDGEVGQLRALQNLGHMDWDKFQQDNSKGLGFFPRQIEDGNYNPMTDMILMPYNKAVGTLELNKYIAQFLGRKRNAVVHEVIAGFIKHYLAVGDKVFYDREEAIITKINKNANYAGRIPQVASVTLDRWGHNQAGEAQTLDQDEFDSIDNLLKSINVDDDEERKNQSSHVIYVKKIADMEDGKDHEDCENENSGNSLRTAAEVNSLIGGYALTIHKSQGSQWKKVYCIFHNSHNRNLQRELLYTAITRAQKELYVIAEPETFIQGVTSQHIIGNTLAQKAEYFKGKVKANKARDDLFNSTQGNTTQEDC